MKQLSRAVQERRAPGEVAADDPIRARWRALDWFASPPWACRAGAELLKNEIDEFAENVWEPACGDGIMVRCLGEYFSRVYATDIDPQRPFADFGSHDFLLAEPIKKPVNYIFTNPPFKHAAAFARRGLDIVGAHGGVMLLCRLTFLESIERYPLMRDHLTHVAVFSERVPMQLGPWNPECSTATAYAWFVFSKIGVTDSTGRPKLHLIPPGTRARLTKPDDIARFCSPAPAPLLGPDTSTGG